MCISPAISSIFPMPIMYTDIQEISPCFILHNNLVIIIKHNYIINISVLFCYFTNSDEFFLNANDLRNRIFYRWTLLGY